MIKESTNEITLSSEQRALFDIMETTKQHMFITGRAGAGKSVLFRYFMENTKKRAVKAAPTGIAAMNIKGSTLHSLFHLPTNLHRKGSLKPDEKVCTALRQVDCLLIDEISMVRADLLDAVNERLQEAKNTDEPFGGVQILMYGDVFQLPPVVDDTLTTYFEHVHGGPFFFNALVWKHAEFKVYQLEQVFRQKDPNFKEALNAIRDGSFTDNHVDRINARYGSAIPAEGVITLATTNSQVTQINQKELDKLPGKAHNYYADIVGEMKKNTFPTEEILQLKKNAQIVFLKNDKDKRWINGTVGRVEDMFDTYIKVSVNGITYNVDRETWEEMVYEYDQDTGKLEMHVASSFTQFPVRLAWALTIHKSQGQTYEQVCIDLTRPTFAPGQLYVGLSRAVSLEGLYLKKAIKKENIIVDTKVKEFMSRVETITIEEVAEELPDAAEVVEAAEEILQQPAQLDAPASKRGRKPKSDDERVVKLDVRLDPSIRAALSDLMSIIESPEITDEGRARMVPNSTHKVASLSDVLTEGLLNLPAFQAVWQGSQHEQDYQNRKAKRQK